MDCEEPQQVHKLTLVERTTASSGSRPSTAPPRRPTTNSERRIPSHQSQSDGAIGTFGVASVPVSPSSRRQARWWRLERGDDVCQIAAGMASAMAIGRYRFSAGSRCLGRRRRWHRARERERRELSGPVSMSSRPRAALLL